MKQATPTADDFRY